MYTRVCAAGVAGVHHQNSGATSVQAMSQKKLKIAGNRAGIVTRSTAIRMMISPNVTMPKRSGSSRDFLLNIITSNIDAFG